MDENQVAASSGGAQIYDLIPRVKEAIGTIAKSKKNLHHGYNFRGIDDVLNAVGPALVACGVSQSIEMLDCKTDFLWIDQPKKYLIQTRLKIRVTLHAPDGSRLSLEAFGEAQDTNGDKSTSKAMSVAYKYAMTLGLCIPIEAGDLPDSDYDNRPDDLRGQQKQDGQAQPRRAAQGRQQQKPANTTDVFIKAEQAILAMSTESTAQAILSRINDPAKALTDEQRHKLREQWNAKFAQIMGMKTGAQVANGHAANGHAANGSGRQ